jgi:hypothetical protein
VKPKRALVELELALPGQRRMFGYELWISRCYKMSSKSCASQDYLYIYIYIDILFRLLDYLDMYIDIYLGR